jgi:hypothetical protein
MTPTAIKIGANQSSGVGAERTRGLPKRIKNLLAIGWAFGG